MKKQIIWAILILAFLLRVVGLQNHPTGFTPDEASFGYDAYSILKTGKDQWGNTMPLSLRSFGDFKMPLYAYLDIPFVATLGLNEVAVRLPNAIIGSLAVLTTYYLVLEIFKKRHIALTASFLLAVSPWHIPMSRGAFEANMTTFLLPLGILLFYRKKYAISAIIFGLNVFSYHSARLVTPLIVTFLLFKDTLLLPKVVTKNFKFIVIFGFFIILAFYTVLTGAGSRATTSAIFSPTGGWGGVSDARFNSVLVGLPDDISRVFNNKVTFVVEQFVRNYFSYFSPQFLFTQGPNEGTYGMVSGVGVLYLIELPLLAGFIWGLATGKFRRVNWLLFWILVAPIPAALAKGPGHAANRAVIMLPAIQIALALGFWFLIEKLGKFKKKFILSYSVILAVSLLFFFEDYFFQQQAREAKSMIFGTRQVIEEVSKIEGQYSEIVISKSISEPHIYVAFYKKIDPKVIQKISDDWLLYEKEGLAWLDQLGTYRLNNFTFRSINYTSDAREEGILLVGAPNEFPENVSNKKIVSFPNGKDAYWIVDPANQGFANAN